MQNKNYIVVFYLSWNFEGIEFKCKNLTIKFQADERAEHFELNEAAYNAILKEYKNFFDYDNFLIHIIGVSNGS